jgi:uncharacterized lipoprotein
MTTDWIRKKKESETFARLTFYKIVIAVSENYLFQATILKLKDLLKDFLSQYYFFKLPSKRLYKIDGKM